MACIHHWLYILNVWFLLILFFLAHQMFLISLRHICDSCFLLALSNWENRSELEYNRLTGLDKQLSLSVRPAGNRNRCEKWVLNIYYRPPCFCMVSSLFHLCKSLCKIDIFPTVFHGHPWCSTAEHSRLQYDKWRIPLKKRPGNFTNGSHICPKQFHRVSLRFSPKGSAETLLVLRHLLSKIHPTINISSRECRVKISIGWKLCGCQSSSHMRFIVTQAL